MSKRWQISRRTLLRGTGAAVALPLLDSMAPVLSRVAASVISRKAINRYSTT